MQEENVKSRRHTAEIVDEGPFSDEEREQAIIGESAKLGVKVRVMTLNYKDLQTINAMLTRTKVLNYLVWQMIFCKLIVWRE